MSSRQSYVFDHKLTDEEIHELVENYEYYPDYEDDGILWDRFGNPTESMIRWKYELNHGLDEPLGPMTIEEFFDEVEKWRMEVDEEEANIPHAV